MVTATQRATRKKVKASALGDGQSDETKARCKYLCDLAKASRSVRMAAIAASAEAMKDAPLLPEETELTDALGGEDFLD